MSESKPKLRLLSLHVVDHCNFACKGCNHFSPELPTRLHEAKDYIDGLNKVESIARIPRVSLLGGEPTLHPRLEHFASEIVSGTPNVKYRLVTNGWWLKSDRMTEKLLPAFRTIGKVEISLHPGLVMPQKDLENSITKLRNRGLDVTFRPTGKFGLPEFSENHAPRTECSISKCFHVLPGMKMSRCAIIAFSPSHVASKNFQETRNTGVFDLANASANSLASWLKNLPHCCHYCLYDKKSVRHKVRLRKT